MGRIVYNCLRSEVAAVDARYEQGARYPSLLAPKLPDFTGRVARVQAFSF